MKPYKIQYEIELSLSLRIFITSIKHKDTVLYYD